jgi:hypothetical protein
MEGATSLRLSKIGSYPHVQAGYPDLWQTVDEGEDARKVPYCIPPQQHEETSMYKSVNPNVHYSHYL